MISRIQAFFRALLGRPRLETDMDCELRFHMEAYAADLAARGVPVVEAERRARLEFGSFDEVREECREARGLRWPDEFARNVRYAVRVLRQSPAFTATALLTLALCVGANTAIFSVVDAVLFRPLPYPHAERLVSPLFEGDNSYDGETWFEIHQQATALDSAVFSLSWGANFSAGRHNEYVQLQRVSAGFFRVYGVAPLAGREFTETEDRVGGPAVAVLSCSFWQHAFHGDRSILGRSILLRGEPHTVVGIMPEGFTTDNIADVWAPLRPSTTGEGAGSNYSIVARLRPGVAWAQAEAQLDRIGHNMVDRFRRSGRLFRGAPPRLRIVPLQHNLSREMRTPLFILWAAVGAVLLIGCVNIAGLLLARGATRTREIATRIALGGGRAAVVRQLLTESLVLGVAGGILGIGAGYGGILLLRRYAVEAFGVWQPVALDVRVLLVALAMALVTSLLFGLAPALVAIRTDLRGALAEGGMRGVAGSSRLWPRRMLVTAEVALGFVLLIGAGLLARTLGNLAATPAGFTPAGVLSAKVSLQDVRYRTAAQMNRLYDQTLERIHQTPGVELAAAGLSLPYERPLNIGFRRTDGPEPDQDYRSINFFYVTPDYFRVLRMPLLAGRQFSLADGPQTELVAIVNRAFVKRRLHGANAVGLHLRTGDGKDSVLAIVGVVGDVCQREDFTAKFQVPAPEPAMYIPAAQMTDKPLPVVHTWFTPSWIVRAAGAEPELATAVTRAVEAADPLLPVAGFRSMTDVRSDSVRGYRLVSTLLTILAALALLLAAVGIYGLVANSVAVRTRELGIRVALGASPVRTIGTVAIPGVGLALAGMVVGAALSHPAAKTLQSLLVGITSDDPATYGIVAVGLAAVATAASVIPALRISRLNPAQTLRHE